MPLVLALLACAQWLILRFSEISVPSPWSLLSPGACIVGAAFLATWACEAAEVDLPQNVSIGIVALIAILPEYAVDFYFAWKGGRIPAYTPFATANMTGANRLLIGLGWPAVLWAHWYRSGERHIRLSERNAVELAALLAATLYSFILPLKATLSLMDSAVLLSLFALYAYLSSKAGTEEPALEGTAENIARLPKLPRRLAVAGLFAGASIAILASARPFAEAILESGRRWGIEEFLLVQWLAPVASETPEFVVAMVLAMKGKPGVGLRALIASKVNQWTVLVGMLPIAYCVSGGRIHSMALDARQIEEIFLTSAQSLFGLALLMNFDFSFWEAASLFLLFVGQLAFPTSGARYGFAAGYLALAVFLMAAQGHRRERLRGLLSQISLKRS